MTPRRAWFERKFTLQVPVDQFPEVLERLRGTPARLEERVRSIPPAVLVRRPAGCWSIQENVGHLLDLEPLWSRRLAELVRGTDVLEAADLKNRATHEARHNERPIQELLGAFRAERQALVARLEGLGEAELAAEALHPRLRQPLNVVGLAAFVAEHDDHHLATIGAILRSRHAIAGTGGKTGP